MPEGTEIAASFGHTIRPFRPALVPMLLTGGPYDAVAGVRVRGVISLYAGGKMVRQSRGQLQRVLIARAVLRNAPVILLDEATSALDHETESKVLKNIINDDPDKIFILTTHKKTVLEHCNRICSVTADGKIE